LLHVLLGSNVEMCRRRLATMPEGQRADVMQGLGIEKMDQRELAGYATLVRGELSPQDSTRIIAQAASLALLKKMDYAELDAVLDRLEATPAERAATVAERVMVLQSFGFSPKAERKDFEALRNWIGKQSPDSDREKMTGSLLASVTRMENLGYDEAVAIALDFRQASGSDEALATLLEDQAAGGNRQKIVPLLEKIADPQRRAKILGLLDSAPDAPTPP
nr:hypothetical protein [Akkermansiaceae bacterium]